MTAVAVEISPRRPVQGDVAKEGGQSYLTRPVLAACPPVTKVTAVADMDSLMETAECSCSAGDDVPF